MYPSLSVEKSNEKSNDKSIDNRYIQNTVILRLKRELIHKQQEFDRFLKQQSTFDQLLNDTIKKLEVTTNELVNTTNELKITKKKIQKLIYADNEFKRMSVIEERDDLLQQVEYFRNLLNEKRSS